MLKNLGAAGSIGEAWMTVLREIMTNGIERAYSDNPGVSAPAREVLGLTLSVRTPDQPDPIIQRYMQPGEYAWMEDNFTRVGPVEALCGESSYASRLYRYMGEKDQFAWVARRLRADPPVRSASVTMFEPLTDEGYIPCVSLLDFQALDGTLDLYVYCRALDFGTKAYANMAMLYAILRRAADEAGLACGEMTLVVKSAHVYASEYPRVQSMLEENPV